MDSKSPVSATTLVSCLSWSSWVVMECWKRDASVFPNARWATRNFHFQSAAIFNLDLCSGNHVTGNNPGHSTGCRLPSHTHHANPAEKNLLANECVTGCGLSSGI